MNMLRSTIAQMASRLFALQRRDKQILQCLSDGLAVLLAFIAAYAINGNTVMDAGLLMQGAVVALLTLCVLLAFGVYRAMVRYLTFGLPPHVLAAVMVSVVLLQLSAVGLGTEVPFRLNLDYSILLVLFLMLPRHLMRWLYESLSIGERETVLIYGAGTSGRALAMALRRHPSYQLVGFVDEDPALQGAQILGLTVFTPERFERAADDGLTRILLAMPRAGISRRREIIHDLEPLGVAIQTVPDMGDLVSGRARVSELRNVAIEDLLGRDAVPPDPVLIAQDLRDQVVMVTGAGGSIGSELCRQIMPHKPAKLILYERSEHALYSIETELRTSAIQSGSNIELVPVLGSVVDSKRLASVLHSHHVATVYHAAAYKHVPLVESNPMAAIENNMLGTWYVGCAALEAGVANCVLISTDKAVRPTNVMGASKRLAELAIQALARGAHKTRFSMVRFGNVLGSSGSVVPLFRSQIEAGGPVTVTHAEVIRYFMTIPEAAQLVIQAGAMDSQGDVFLLDMGEPVNILELAKRMIRLSGYKPRTADEPDGDIEIRLTGLRPGEKLYEELLVSEQAQATCHPRIMRSNEPALERAQFERLLNNFKAVIQNNNLAELRQLLLDAPLHYQPESTAISDMALAAERDKVVRAAFNRHSA